MKEFMLLMHDDATGSEREDDWGPYLAGLRAKGAFDGGSSLAAGEQMRKGHSTQRPHHRVVGFVRVRAPELSDAKLLVAGNPTYEAGGTVDIREVIKD